MSSHNNNPKGNNQYKACPSADDPGLQSALRAYHKQGRTNYTVISELLLADHQIELSPTTVKRRMKALGLFASGKTSKRVPEQAQRQLVLDELEVDPNNHLGPRLIRANILDKTGIPLRRDFVRQEMLQLRPEGFDKREPTAKRIPRGVLYALGPHDEWSGDGHDKLTAIGFPLWGIRDKWSGYWLGLWVVPNNRLADVVGYLFLSVVYEYGGIPNQTTTDCGSETTKVYALGNALRNIFAADIDTNDAPAHQYLRSVHNIVIERGWLRLRLEWGDNIASAWQQGIDDGIYNENIPAHYNLARWLWSTLVQADLGNQRRRLNGRKTRKDHKKVLPSGASPHEFMSLPEKWGGKDCLHPVDREIVKKMMEELGGEALLRFVEPELGEHYLGIYTSIGSPPLEPQYGWDIFRRMLTFAV